MIRNFKQKDMYTSRIRMIRFSWRPMLLISFFAGLFPACRAQRKSLGVGDPVPAFILRDQNDSLFNVQDHIGKNILVIYFYPKDESSVCTREACAFRDGYAEFSKAGALVVGINSGSVASHKHFQENHQLPFTLLSDPGNRVLNLFGVRNWFMISGRKTFVVDKSGKIRFTYDSFTNGPKHEAEALKMVRELAAEG
jgi:peroxiredoxin Q/BCP